MSAALPVKNRQMFINGTWCDASNGQKLPVVNPATEETIAEVSFGTRADTARAVAAASAALPGWMKLTAYDRAKFLKKTADLMRERADNLARVMTMEQGKPLVEAKGEVLHSADTFEWFAEEGKRAYGQVIPPANAAKRHMTIKHPVGVVGAIAPWNFPLTLLCRKISPALAAGCTIVAKPSELTPLCGIALFELLADAGLPPGVANLVLGLGEEVAGEFMENPAVRKVSFTGSTRVGKILMRQAADQVKRLSLELGGHAPFIVFPDADPEVVAKAAVLGKFRNNGQVCISPSRFFVHQDVAKRFTEVAVEEAKKLKLGNGLEEGVVVGPMIEQKRVDATRELIADATGKGAACLTGGGRPKGSAFEQGYFIEPTILRGVTPNAKILTDEPFAPVMPVLDFSKIDEVIAQANNTKYGLAAYVFTNDLSVAWKMAEGLEAGIIGINDPVPAAPQCPFGGMKESGMGRELAHEGLEAYLETKYVSMMLRG
ncbi:MAG TPA: NAD-dependent succinate-semialdehyde dehydrogenase [Gemmata sp.]